MLGRDPETIKNNHQALRDLGLTDRKIASQAQLLGRDPETIKNNHQYLKTLGLTDSKIASRAELIGRDPETIKNNHQYLKNLGLTDRNISTNAHLLARDPETIERYYQYHVGLLREDYLDRGSGRELILSHASLLGIPPKTMEANVQYLSSIGIDYHNGFLLGSRPSTKRRKLAWMLRELFDYRDIPRDHKREVIGRLYHFVRENPRILAKSLHSLERSMDKLRERIQEY